MCALSCENQIFSIVYAVIVCVCSLCFSGEQFNAVVKQMSWLAQEEATELRVRSLEAIAQLLTLPVRICV